VSKRWLTLGLLLVLTALLVVVWSNKKSNVEDHYVENGHVVDANHNRWSLPPPIPDTLFEDFSEMPDQGAPARLLPTPPPVPSTAQVDKRGRDHGRIALILDDIGNNLHAERQLLALPFPLAISVLPQSQHPKQAATLAHQDGRVVMLHLPMEPTNPTLRSHLGSGFLRLKMSNMELQEKFHEALSQVPFVQGVNNHMGSLLTTNRNAMAVVMAKCHRHGLFFVDSRTVAKSVAADEAEKAGLRWASRQVFLDHIDDATSIARAWHHAELIADQRGSCVVIGHPRKKTIAFLTSLKPSVAQHMVSITELLHR